jgi:hypothetical protein
MFCLRNISVDTLHTGDTEDDNNDDDDDDNNNNIGGKIEERIEMMERLGRRCQQLVDGLKEKRGYWKFK